MKKIAFLDRDGTLIEEPADLQIDSLAKFRLLPDVIPSLLKLRDAGFAFVMVTNQDGLGGAQYPQAAFDEIQKLLLGILETQGIRFERVLICPHRGRGPLLVPEAPARARRRVPRGSRAGSRAFRRDRRSRDGSRARA